MNIFPSNQEKIITTSIFGFFVGASLVLVTKIELSELFTPITILFAAYIGAYYAFNLQNNKQKRDLISKRVESGNKAIFNLVRSYNNFYAYQSQFIEPNKSKPLYFLMIPPSANFEFNTNFNFDSLAYLFETDDPNILGELSQFEAEANACVELIKERSRMHIHGVQASLEKEGITQGMEIRIDQYKDVIGERLFVMMKQSTDQIIESTQTIISMADNLINKLHKIHFNEYKGYKILKMGKMNEKNI